MNRCKKILLFCNCVIAFFPLFAQDTSEKGFSFQGYSGGMMLHSGYLFGGHINLPNTSESVAIRGIPFGLGGTLRVHFGEHFRVGMEGHSSTLHYGENNKSFVSLGWGGLLVDWHWKIKRTAIFCGGTIGGGSVKNIAVLNNVNSIEKNAVYRKYSVMVVNPFIGAEYALTDKIRWITKIDCIVNLTQRQSDFAIGPRVYTGFVFFHARKGHK